MTYMRPKFEQGLFGSANKFVCNRWTDSSELVAESTEGIRWAQSQLVQGNIVAQGLCSITAAAALATNRWTYTVSLWVPASIAGAGISTVTDPRFNYTTCRNLREEFNTATIVDGMDITTPASTIGPVGSVWTGSAWTTSSLTAVAMVSVVYDLGGNAYAFFDRPNPIRCTEV
jgi:hypothetical protein